MQVDMQGQLGGLGRGQVEAAEKGFIQDLGCEGQVSIQLVSHTHTRTHARTHMARGSPSSGHSANLHSPAPLAGL